MDIRLILVQVFVILFAITIHEASHAWTASRMTCLGVAIPSPLFADYAPSVEGFA